MSTLTISVIQSALRWHDPEGNRATFATQMDAIEGQPDLIVLPEMFTTGFTMQAAEQAESVDGATTVWLQEQARNRDCAVCGSVIVEDGGRYFNRFLFADPGGQVHCYDKRHLFRLANEERYYSPGTARKIVEFRGVRLCPQVCYDLRFPVWSRRQNDYDLLIYVANWPSARHYAWQTLLRARAIENQVFVVGVNRTGTDGNALPYAGGSAVVDYLGETLADLGDAPGVATVTIDFDKQRDFQARFPFDRDADRFELQT